MSYETDARLAKLREKSRALSESMRNHEDRLNRISSRLADSQSSARLQQISRDNSAIRASSMPTSPDLKGVQLQFDSVSGNAGVSRNGSSTRSPLRASALGSPHRANHQSQFHSRSSHANEKSTSNNGSPELSIMSAAKDYASIMREKNLEIEELRRVVTVSTVKLRLAEEEVERLKAAEAKARASNLEISGVVEKLGERCEIQEGAKQELATRVLALERSLELSQETTKRFQEELTKELMNTESAYSAQRTAEEACAQLKEMMEKASKDEGDARKDLRAERVDFVESQKRLREETMSLTHEISSLSQTNSNLRSKSAALERATVGQGAELKQLKALHNATVQQLLGTRDQLREEQVTRRRLEADIARYRGAMHLQQRLDQEQ